MKVSFRKDSTRNTQFYRVDVGFFVFWFSYQTIVAFYDPSVGHALVCENLWGPTTGRHLNERFGTFGRTPSNEFEERLNAAFDKIGLVKRVLSA